MNASKGWGAYIAKLTTQHRCIIKNAFGIRIIIMGKPVVSLP